MTNQLTQAELELAKQAGFSFRGDPTLEGAGIWFEPPNGSQRYFVHVAPELAKFAQLIQQREATESIGWRYRKLNPDNGWRSPWKVAGEETNLEILKKVCWERDGHTIEVEQLYTTPPTASQLVAQALERAAQILEIELGMSECSDMIIGRIRALIDQPVEPTSQESRQVDQGGDELVAEALLAAKYFIINGTALGYIRMPAKEHPDPAHNTLPLIEKALSQALSNRRGGE